MEEKPEPKPWGNFTVPMIPNLAQGHIPEHFNLVQAVDEGRNIVKITSSKYDKLSATIEPVMAGEAEMYLIDPQEHTGYCWCCDYHRTCFLCRLPSASTEKAKWRSFLWICDV